MVSLQTFIILAILVSAITSDSDPNSNRIVGGLNASPGQFPYQVSIRDRMLNRHFCGGSILNAFWIVTAGHCAFFRSPRSIQVAVGSVHIAQGQLYDISDVIVNRDFNRDTLQNDIALLKTSTPIMFSEFVKPVDMARDNVNTPLEAVASGWGLTTYPGEVPETLQFLEMNIITTDECKKMLTFVDVFQTTLCVLNKMGEGLCRGDSGGPLVANNTLLGIVSFGMPCAKGVPDGLTKVAEYYGWIQSMMN